MRIGVPKEIKKQEHRVALLPSAAYQLIKRGHQVLVERGAGDGSGFGDAEYERAGTQLIADAAEVFDRAELIVKVKEPQPSEVAMLRPGQILFTYLHLAADKALTEALAKSGVTGIAYETIEVNRRLPLLEPMSEIAGRMSVLVGGYFLAKHYGGSGTLLGGVPGVLAGKVVVLGGGTSGVNAARMATGLGADVTILEVDLERMRFLDITLSTAHTLYSDESHLLEMLPSTDLLIGAVLVPGAKAPKLIRRDMLKLMRPGSVLVDIAIDQGGCAETSRPTTHENPVFVEEGVTHYCVANMPGAYARTATQALTNATHRYVELLADYGLAEACQRQPALRGGINVMGGHITHPAVATAHGLPCRPVEVGQETWKLTRKPTRCFIAMLRIKFFTAGGTIDKVYFDAKSEYEVGPPQVIEILQEAHVTLDYAIESVLSKDSLDMTEEDRRLIRQRVAADACPWIVITHGTDTMVETARSLEGIPGKTIVLTGSMQPARFKVTDAVFNIGTALGAVQCLRPGVYIAMNGRVFDPARTRKNVAERRFEEIG